MINLSVFQKVFREKGSDEVVVKLTNEDIRQAVDQVVKHKKSTKSVAEIYNVSQRRIQQLVKAYRDTEKYPKLNPNRRPRRYLTNEEKKIIEKAYKESLLGARLLRHHIKKYYNVSIPQNKIHEYLIERGYAHPNPKKQKKRNQCKHERLYSLSLLHSGWLEYRGKMVIVYLDDISRYIVALGEFKEATPENAIDVLKKAESVAEYFSSTICTINMDRESQFYTEDKKGNDKFEEYLEKKGIEYICSRKKTSQTNGKLYRWFREYKRCRKKLKSSEKFRNWYNRRIHGALSLEMGETPKEAFVRRLGSQSLCGLFWKRMEG